MTTAKKYNIEIAQGKTFTRVVRWESLPLVYKEITAVGQVAPALITAVGHGCPEGWRAYVTGVVGMDEINAHVPVRGSDFHRVTVESADQVSFNDLSAADFDPYVSGGYLVYYTPVDLSGFTARMKIKDRVGGTVLESLSTASEIVIDELNCTITVTIPAADTEAYEWTRGVYDLEVVSPTGVVTALLSGTVSVSKEVTTS